jgi:hypothetical protein
MVSSSSVQDRKFSLIPDFWGLGWPSRAKSPKIHNYTAQIKGEHYFIELADPAESPQSTAAKFYMTAHGAGLTRHDYILLQTETGTTQYQIEAIDYYSDPPTLWTALLTQC